MVSLKKFYRFLNRLKKMVEVFSIFGLVYFDILPIFKERRYGNLLLSFYILYLLIRNGSTKKQLLCLSLLMIYQLYLEVWVDWQENSDEFELLESIGFNVGKSVFKWLAFCITIANSKIPIPQSKNLKIFQFYFFGEKSKLQGILSKHRKSIDINHDGNTEHLSILGNHLKIVQLLLQTFKHNVNSNEECMVCVYF